MAAIPGPPAPAAKPAGQQQMFQPTMVTPQAPAPSNVGTGLPGTLGAASNSVAGVGSLGDPTKTATQGYNQALGTLQSALGNTNNMFSGQQAAAGQQLQQNQGAVQQGMINKGLDNTTVSQTMQQAPLATYNQAMLNIANSQAGAQNGILGQIAGMYAGGGQDISGLQQSTNNANMQFQAPLAQQQLQQTIKQQNMPQLDQNTWGL